MRFIRCLILAGSSFLLSATTWSSQSLMLDFPVMTGIYKNQLGSGLMVRASQYHFSSVYRNDRFSDLSIHFEVVRKQESISLYQLTISELYHHCEQSPLSVLTMMDGVEVVRGQRIENLSFPYFDGTNDFNHHQAQLQFPTIVAKEIEQSCYGVISVSVSEQI